MGKKEELDTRFGRFGTVSFTSVTKVNDFVDFLEKGNLSGTRCKGCGLVFFPPRSDCYRCLSGDVEWFEVSGTGKLVSYSKLEYAPVGFQDDLPYCIAVLDYGDYKIFGRIDKDMPEKKIRVGMRMKAVVHELPNGRFNYVFQEA